MDTNMTPPELHILLTPDAARFIGAKESTLEKWRLRGDGPPFIRIGPRKIGYLRSDLDAWLVSRRHQSTSEPAR